MASADPKAVAKWVDAANGWIPQSATARAVVGGYDMTGELLYVGRALHGSDLIPGKINRTHGVCYVPFNGQEIAKESYQVLAELPDSDSKLEWIKDFDGHVPKGAIQGGLSRSREPYYIGRFKYLVDRRYNTTTLAIGAVSPSKRGVSFAYGGSERFFPNDYEVLCVKMKRPLA